MEDLDVFDELGEDAQAALGGFVEQDIGRLGIAHGNHTDFVGLDLEYPFDGAFQGMLQGDDAFRLQSERLNRLDVEGIGEIGCPELDEAEFLLEIGIILRHRARQSPEIMPIGNPSLLAERHCLFTCTRRAAGM